MAQERPAPRGPYWEIALQPVAVMTLPTGTLASIRGSVPCSPDLSGATSVNAGIGAHVGYVLSDEPDAVGIRLRAAFLAIAYDDLSSTFSASTGRAYDAFDAVNGAYREVNTEHRVQFDLSALRLAPTVDIALGGNLHAQAWFPSICLTTTASSRETETVLSPSNATFLDHTQVREIAEGTGTIAEKKLRIGAGVAVAYRLPLGGRLFFEPNIGVDVGLTSIQPSWSPLLVRGGIGIGYRFLPSPPPPPAPVETPPVAVIPEQPARPAQAPFTANASVEVSGVKLPLEFRRQVVARYVPVLPTIFFERNADGLPERYVQFAPPGTAPRGGEAASFDENTVSSNAEQAHYQTLNIFARRLLASPKTRVTITGTTSRDEDGRADLAQARARAVAEYLMKAWGIAPARITMRSRLDPAVLSNGENAEGLAENRRVELEFSDDAIYRPLQLRSVEPMTEPAEIPFRARATSASRIERWSIDAAVGEQRRTIAEGEGSPDGVHAWRLTSEDREKILSSGAVRYNLKVADSLGRTVVTEPKSLPLRLDTTVSVATSATRPDNTAEFLLVTFDFDRADLTRRGKLELGSILDRIGPDSHIAVTGYTDAVGEAERNRALALERARRVAGSMPAGSDVEYRGAAPDEAPYGSTSPEGRFLSRTVRVVITNPK